MARVKFSCPNYPPIHPRNYNKRILTEDGVACDATQMAMDMFAKRQRISDVSTSAQTENNLLMLSDLTTQNNNTEEGFQQLKYSCSYKNCCFTSQSWSQVKSHEYRRHMKLVFKCIQPGCQHLPEFPVKDAFNQHLMEEHGISQFRCGIEGCNRAFINRFV